MNNNPMLRRFLLLFLIFTQLPAVLLVAEDGPPLKAYVVPIEGDIDPVLVVFLRRSIEKAKEAKANYIVFDINTFGGRVDSALQIAALIGTLENIKTIAFVTLHPESLGVSWSAGALISFSCNAIYMAPGTSIGAAAPVYEKNGEMVMAEEKVVSAVRTQMAALAEKNGYPVGIAVAMVDMDVELLEVTSGGKMEFIDARDLEVARQQAREQGREFTIGHTVSPKGKLLSLTAQEMARYGLSSGTVNSVGELFRQETAGQTVDLVNVKPSAPDSIVAFFASMAVSFILIFVGGVALYIEITTPGFGVPGVVALICFSTLFLTQFLLGMVGSLEILLFIVGVSLLFVELFLIPGFGLTGYSGIVCIILSLILAQQDFIIPHFDWQWKILVYNSLMVIISMIMSFFTMLLIVSTVPRLAPFKRFTLLAEQKPELGFVVQTRREKERYMGRRGRACTKLRPAGKADIDGLLLDVESDGEFIGEGEEIQVIAVTGNKIKVARRA